MEKMYISHVCCWPVLQVCTLLPVTGMKAWNAKLGQNVSDRYDIWMVGTCCSRQCCTLETKAEAILVYRLTILISLCMGVTKN
jgi:hypothetical protein